MSTIPKNTETPRYAQDMLRSIKKFPDLAVDDGCEIDDDADDDGDDDDDDDDDDAAFDVDCDADGGVDEDVDDVVDDGDEADGNIRIMMITTISGTSASTPAAASASTSTAA